MLNIKLHDNLFFGSGEVDFEGVLLYMGVAVILVT